MRPAAHRRPRRVMFLCVMAALLAVSACVPTPPEEPSVSPCPSSPSGSPAEGTTDVIVEMMPNGSCVDTTYRVVCVDGAPAAGTDHPSPEEACAFLTESGEAALTALPNKNVRCTQVYGGPQVAVVTGTVDGTPVNKRFALRDGCEISAWKAAEALLGRGSSSGV
jgi:hypothetical protein